MIFSWIVSILVNDVGMNIWLARLVSLVPTVVCVVALTYSLSFIPQFQKAFPFIKSNKKKRLIGNITLVACILTFFTFMYISETTKRFNPLTGESIMCLARGLDGYEEISCNWKYHPTTGSPVVKDKKTLRELYSASDPQTGSIDTVSFNENIRLFTAEGSPLVWYHKLADGTIQLFDSPGRHPQLNVKLMPMNSKVAQEILYGTPKQKKKIVLGEPGKKNNPLVDLKKHLEQMQAAP